MNPTLPVVAIVGRPNVGKSTLLNRVLGRREAIVEELPGVTRDRKSVEADWSGRSFELVDTGGWLQSGSELDGKVSLQSERAIAEADVVLLVCDVTVGVTSADEQVAKLINRTDTPCLVIVNKVDDHAREVGKWEFMRLGLGEPFGVSAIHGLGTGDMLDALVALLPPAEPEPVDPWAEPGERERTDRLTEDGRPAFAVALVGRPNVGKSTLFNQMSGSDRAVVHDMPGTTRDSIDTLVDTDVGRIRFVDTAGMRRKSKIDIQTEYYSALRALESVDAADVCLLVIDATEGVTAQDQRLAERVDASGCPIVVVLNKWDLITERDRADVERSLERKLAFVGDSPVLRLSALTGKGVNKILPLLGEAIGVYRKRVPTRQVNEVLRRAQSLQAAPGGARVLYATQGATDPPTFTLFVNRELPATYLRYLERELRTSFELGSTPIKLRVRNRSD